MNIKIFFGELIYKIEKKIEACKAEYYRSIVNSGKNVYIVGDNTLIYPKNIYIGNNSFINGNGCIVASLHAKIIIGENCMIARNVHIRTDKHLYVNRNIPMQKQDMIEKDIVVGNDVWIGYGSQIMSGVIIGDGAVIGAGAIVTKNVEPYSVYVGIPAKKIRSRE